MESEGGDKGKGKERRGETKWPVINVSEATHQGFHRHGYVQELTRFNIKPNRQEGVTLG